MTDDLLFSEHVNRSWPPANPDDIRKLRLAGKSDIDIGKIYLRSDASVYLFRRKHGILEPLVNHHFRNRANFDARPPAQIPVAIKLNASPERAPSIKASPALALPKLPPTQSASHICRVEPGKAGRSWTQAEDKRILEMDAAGALTIDIAMAIDRTPGQVHVRREDLQRSGRPRRSVLKETGSLLDYRPHDEEPGDIGGHYDPVDPAEGIPRRGGE